MVDAGKALASAILEHYPTLCVDIIKIMTKEFCNLTIAGGRGNGSWLTVTSSPPPLPPCHARSFPVENEGLGRHRRSGGAPHLDLANGEQADRHYCSFQVSRVPGKLGESRFQLGNLRSRECYPG
jgi:hypothetical protein